MFLSKLSIIIKCLTFYKIRSDWRAKHRILTRIRLSSTTYSLSILSRPRVDLRSLLATNVLLAKRRNIDVLPTPYSPHSITFCSVTLTVAMSSSSTTSRVQIARHRLRSLLTIHRRARARLSFNKVNQNQRECASMRYNVN